MTKNYCPAHQGKGSHIRLRMHLRASRTLWLPEASSGSQTPGRNGTAYQKGGKLVNCSHKTERIFVWNHSFGPRIRLIMHLRASRTLWLLGAALVAADGPMCAMANGLGHPRSLKVPEKNWALKICEKDNNGALKWWKNNNRALNLNEKNNCALTSIHCKVYFYLPPFLRNFIVPSKEKLSSNNLM